MKKKDKPGWHSSKWRGEYSLEKKKFITYHEKPLRCPFCGHEMIFCLFFGYEIHSSDWFWECPICGLRMPNKKDFSVSELSSARKKWRKHLEKGMKEAKEKYQRLQKLYKSYGRYFTSEEKRDRLIETIEKHNPKKSLE